MRFGSPERNRVHGQQRKKGGKGGWGKCDERRTSDERSGRGGAKEREAAKPIRSGPTAS